MQIPVDQFTGLPIVNECKSPNNNFMEFVFDNRNIKIDLSKLREEEPDEVRLCQKVLANAHQIQMSSDECLKVLEITNMEVYKAIKVILLRETLREQSIRKTNDFELINVLEQFKWSINQAISHFVITSGDNNGATAV